MSRIVLNYIELTAINGKIWVYDRKAGDGRFLTEGGIAGLLKQKSPAANEANSATTIKEV